MNASWEAAKPPPYNVPAEPARKVRPFSPPGEQALLSPRSLRSRGRRKTFLLASLLAGFAGSPDRDSRFARVSRRSAARACDFRGPVRPAALRDRQGWEFSMAYATSERHSSRHLSTRRVPSSVPSARLDRRVPRPKGEARSGRSVSETNRPAGRVSARRAGSAAWFDRRENHELAERRSREAAIREQR